MQPVTCPHCHNQVTPEEQDDSFDYSGTHCTGGKSGTHHIPIYYTCPICEELLDFTPEEQDYNI